MTDRPENGPYVPPEGGTPVGQDRVTAAQVPSAPGAIPVSSTSGATAVEAPAGTEHHDAYESDPRSLGEIASDVLDNASLLIRQEVDLAKAEVQQMASRTGKGAGMLGGAGVMALFALLFASLAAWWGIAIAIGSYAEPALGWSGLIIFGVYLIVALILMSMGRGELKRVKGLPKTAETVSKIPNAATGNEEKNR